MKVAMWGVGLCVIGLFGLILINLFGNITVTNQFNYTTMKNAVQAAMYDSLDITHYRVGFCLCTTNGSKINIEKQTTFSDKSQYKFSDIVDDQCVNDNGEVNNSCVKLYGQYRINADKFVENFQERFINVLTNNKEYEFVYKEIIEYPPKVSIMVISHDEEFSPTEKDSEGYNITNQIDAIIETDGEIIVEGPERQEVEIPSEETSEEETPTESTGGGTCGWHYVNSRVVCSKNSGSVYQTFQAKELSGTASKSARNAQGSREAALAKCREAATAYCKNKGYDVASDTGCNGTRDWRLVFGSSRTSILTSPTKPTCSTCTSIQCLG